MNLKLLPRSARVLNVGGSEKRPVAGVLSLSFDRPWNAAGEGWWSAPLYLIKAGIRFHGGHERIL